MGVHQDMTIVTLLAAFMGKNISNNSATPSQKYISLQWQEVSWRSVRFTAMKYLQSFLKGIVNS